MALIRFIFIAFAAFGVSLVSFAQNSHKVTFDGRANHYFEVESSFALRDGESDIELVMAGWTPGSYLVRDYARHVENVSVAGGDVQKSAKNRWQLTNIEGETAVVKYRVYAREMTVRTNWVDSSFAFINGASTFMRPDRQDQEEHRIEIVLPDDWSASAASMTKARFRKNIYIAENWDDVIDSPIVAGNLQILEIPAKTPKYPHYLVQVGDTEAWDNEKAVKAVADIIDIQQNFWGSDPFEKPYYFLNIIADARGGLEHKHNTALMHRRFAMNSRDDWVNWLGLVAHEYFHSWNVKRLRPDALGPFDYESENYTSELWFAEGVTSYYDILLNYRAGLMDEDETLKEFAAYSKYLDETAGQEVRSVADASFDAWIRGYRPDENTTNANVSYYSKGAMVALGLDVKIRQATNNGKSLDDLMRRAYELYSGDTGFKNADIYALATEIGGKPVGNWLKARIETPEYLDSSEAYSFLGLNLKNKDDNDEMDEYAPAYLGFHFNSAKTDLVVSKVSKGSPAFNAGVNVGDELIAIDENRVTKAKFKDHMKFLRPNSPVKLLMARRGKLTLLDAVTAEKPLDKWKLSVVEDASEDETENYESWSGR